MGMEKAIFNRVRLLVGDTNMKRLEEARVIIFGVGGVGSWCAESLVRSGVKRLTIVDSDRVSVTNINRQSMANVETIGRVKVEALKEQLLTINPEAEISALQEIFSDETAENFHLEDYDYILDCIDSLKDKASLIIHATQTDGRFYSSMGAALKTDPTRIRVAEFWKVDGCPLGKMLRKRFRRHKTFPRKKFKCVYSDEVRENLGAESKDLTEQYPGQKVEPGAGKPELSDHDWNLAKAQINGSMMHITAIFGLTLAGLVIEDIIR